MRQVAGGIQIQQLNATLECGDLFAITLHQQYITDAQAYIRDIGAATAAGRKKSTACNCTPSRV